MDPVVEIRDPWVDVIDVAGCTDRCSFSMNLSLVKNGCNTIFVSDNGTNETGAYTLQLERILPVPAADHLSYDASVADSIEPGTDIDFFTFNATAGTGIRFNVLASADLMDPVVEIRDPNGTLVVDGVTDGATCTDRCSFSVDLSPALTGVYSLLIYDRGTNESGSYQLSLWCLSGKCDGAPDPAGPLISYDDSLADTISPAVDGDFFTFNATAGTNIRLNVLAGADLMDPVIEIRDSNDTLVVNGVADGATCTDRCSFSVDLSPVLSGVYSLLIYDRGTNESGSYQLSLWCLSGKCDGAPDPKGPYLSYATPVADVISPAVDGDFFIINATAGTDIRLNVLAGADLMDPVVEIRDSSGALVLNGVADGATCTDRCSFSVDLSPATSDTYSLLVYDRGTNESGSYQLSLWCLWGDCDSDADSIPDGNYPVSMDTPTVLQYGLAAMDEINPAVDGDIFTFEGTSTSLIRINVLASFDLMDPVIEIRDPMVP